MQTSPFDKIATGESNYEKYKDMFKSGKNDVVTMDSFYKLLVAEMSNQDPLEPTSNTEFISQLASFTSLQAQQDNFALQKQNYANTLVGQIVSVQPDGQKDLVTGVVDHVNFSDEIMVNVDGRDYKLSSIKMVYGYQNIVSGEVNPGDSLSTLESYGAFAAGILGKTITVQSYNSAGEFLLDSGTASSLEIQDGIVRVILNGLAYDVTDIVSVTDAVKVKDDGDDEEFESEATVETGKKPEKTDVSDIENDPDDVKEAESAASQTLVDRTDDYDIQDLEDEEDNIVPAAAGTDPANGQNSGSAGGNTSPAEAEELYSLFGE